MAPPRDDGPRPRALPRSSPRRAPGGERSGEAPPHRMRSSGERARWGRARHGPSAWARWRARGAAAARGSGSLGRWSEVVVPCRGVVLHERESSRIRERERAASRDQSRGGKQAAYHAAATRLRSSDEASQQQRGSAAATRLRMRSRLWSSLRIGFFVTNRWRSPLMVPAQRPRSSMQRGAAIDRESFGVSFAPAAAALVRGQCSSVVHRASNEDICICPYRTISPECDVDEMLNYSLRIQFDNQAPIIISSKLSRVF
jgi:hypothetical protein